MSRPGVLQTYRDEMVSYMKRTFGFSEEEADRRFRLACKDRYKPQTAIIVENVEDGRPELKAVDLVSYLDKHADDIVSPSGSFYMQHERKTGATIQMVQNKLDQRGKLKKDQFKAKAAGDVLAYLTAYFGQSSVKITVNSLPGNYGSSYSGFYDKGNYNAITSGGRALIGYANTCIEHVLGGNFGWFSVEQLINHINIHLHSGIDKEKVHKVMNAHNLKWVDKQMLMEFFHECLRIYHRYKDGDFRIVDELVMRLEKEEVQFFWYYQNLRHVIMFNDEVFRPWINDLFDLSKVVEDPSVKPDDLFKLDGDLVMMCNVAFYDTVKSGNPKIQVYDLPSQMPEKAVKFVNIANRVQKELDKMKDIFDTFIDTELNVPDVHNRKMMQRNSSVISDTDSVIFTVKDWVQWYTGDIYRLTTPAYQISTLMVYWITKAVAHVLAIYSISHGAKGKHIKDMKMKNEFMYPTMCLADIKKTYAGVVTVQEGVILPKPQTDIKGVQLKGSNMCKESTKFAEDFIVDCILSKSLNAKISGHDLIQRVIEREKLIYQDTVNGLTRWCQPESIKNKDGYAKPMSSAYFYFLAWQEIFAWKYGDIQVPTKTIVLPIAEPTAEYFEWLHKESPKICKKFQDFLLKYTKCPSKMAISPIVKQIPRELIPLVMVRDIIYENVKPCRLILSQLGIRCGFDDDKLLFNEVYGEHSLLSRTTNQMEKSE